jgi:hypothetical protein
MEYNYWRFSIQYFGIALVILTSVAGGLAKELWCFVKQYMHKAILTTIAVHLMPGSFIS